MPTHRFAPYPFLLPALLLTVLSVVLPNLYTISLAFTNYSLYHFEEYRWVGLDNFREIFLGVEVRSLLMVFGWTLVWSIGSVLLSLALGLGLALLLNHRAAGTGSGSGWLRTLLILPWALPNFITVLVWRGLLNTDFGLVNLLVSKVGLGPIPWLEQQGWARLAVLLVGVWLQFPFMMSVCLGALQSIPREIYEAAAVDGASRRAQFVRLTLPLLCSTLVPVLITSFAYQFNLFNVIYLLTEGGPPILGSPVGGTDILVTYAYKLAFDQFQFGLSCAYGILIFLVVGTMSVGNFLLTGGGRDENR